MERRALQWRLAASVAPSVHRSVEFRLADAHPFFLSVLLLEIFPHLFGLLDFALFSLFQATLYSPLFQEDLFPDSSLGKNPFKLNMPPHGSCLSFATARCDGA
jgi:hypothetical protein